MATPEEVADGHRLALVVATSTYSDQTLQQLRAPGRDAEAFAEVLQDPKLGDFNVSILVDESSERIKRTLAEFCAEGAPTDVVLVYFSCHGLIDDRGRLYYATVDTERRWLSVTAIPAQWLNEQLDDCRCRRQLLLLDCCHSGAFAKGAKGDTVVALQDRFEARGRVIMTASRATEYSFEGERVLGESSPSRFTEALIDGIRSGAADADKDGLITVPELYDYAFARVKRHEARQTPGIWVNAAEGRFLVARSPLGAILDPAPLPEHLQFAIESASRNIREAAVRDIAQLLTGVNRAVALTARATLQHVAEEDAPAVAAAARAALEEQARRDTEEQARRDAEEQARRDAEEQARRDAEEQARREEEEQARRDAEEQARRDAEEQARREEEEQARRDAEEQARRDTEEQARRDAEEQPTAGRSSDAAPLVGSFATTGDRPARHRIDRRPKKAVVVIVMLLLIGGTLAVVLSPSDAGTEDGPFVTMTSALTGKPAGTANISTGEGDSLILYISAETTRLPTLLSGESHQAFLFNNISKMRRYEGTPPGKPLPGKYGDDGQTSQDYVFAKLPQNYRSFNYAGFVTVGESWGRLLLYTPMTALREP